MRKELIKLLINLNTEWKVKSWYRNKTGLRDQHGIGKYVSATEERIVQKIYRYEKEKRIKRW